jgi:hypothetical protein
VKDDLTSGRWRDELDQALGVLLPHVACHDRSQDETCTTFVKFLTSRVIRVLTAETLRRRGLRRAVCFRLQGGTNCYANFFLIGKSRMRLPVAAKIALQIAGGIGGTPGSPTPAGGASLCTRWTRVSIGASFIRAT